MQYFPASNFIFRLSPTAHCINIYLPLRKANRNVLYQDSFQCCTRIYRQVSIPVRKRSITYLHNKLKEILVDLPAKRHWYKRWLFLNRHFIYLDRFTESMNGFSLNLPEWENLIRLGRVGCLSCIELTI